MKTAWKVLKKGMKSSNGDINWKKGKWQIHTEELQLCNSGLHASELLVDAIHFVTPGIICKVEYDGNVVTDKDKIVCEKMRVIETYRFTKRNAVEFSIFCARLCLENFEKKYPTDKRPRLAIEAAEKFIKNPSQKNMSAARSVWSAAWSAAKEKMNQKLLQIIKAKTYQVITCAFSCII
jgi:hypothetical protein